MVLTFWKSCSNQYAFRGANLCTMYYRFYRIVIKLNHTGLFLFSTNSNSIFIITICSLPSDKSKKNLCRRSMYITYSPIYPRIDREPQYHTNGLPRRCIWFCKKNKVGCIMYQQVNKLSEIVCTCISKSINFKSRFNCINKSIN